MLAYVFWHRPRDSEDVAAYESAVCAFHGSLARSAPAGMIASASYRDCELPWRTDADGDGALRAPAYEDWYLVEDYAALGVLNEAAVGRGHRTRHSEAAQRYGAGAGGLYALLEGEPCARALGEATLAVWVSPARPRGSQERRSELGELMGDGMEPASASLWRRQLVLGPAPEFCVLAREVPSGVGASRLPAGWRASVLEREVMWSS